MSDPTIPQPAHAEQSGAADPAQPPADPPRPLTPAARRRAWTEPRVRRWWLLALGVLALTLYVAVTQVAAWGSERRLVTHGVEVRAVVVRATDPVSFNDISLPGKRMPPHSTAVLEFEWQGAKRQVTGQLPGHMDRGDPVVTGPEEPVTLRIDPNDPDRWTDRTTSPPLRGPQFIAPALGLPAIAVLALAAWAKRRGVLEVWRSGRASPALVVGPAGQTPFAPRSRALRCTPADSTDKRVFTLYLPAGAPAVAAGDVVWAVRPSDRPEPAYAAGWFARGDEPVPSAAAAAPASPAA